MKTKKPKSNIFTNGELSFSYLLIEDSQLGTILFSECLFEDSVWNYIEFDVLSARINFLDEDMAIKKSLKLSFNYDKADQNIGNRGAGVCQDSIKCSC